MVHPSIGPKRALGLQRPLEAGRDEEIQDIGLALYFPSEIVGCEVHRKKHFPLDP